MRETGKALVPIQGNLPRRGQGEVIRRSRVLSSGGVVEHLRLEETQRLLDAMRRISSSRLQERNTLLVKVLFDACLRVSEALGLTPGDVIRGQEGFRLRVLGKGGRPREVAISPSVAAELQAFAYEHNLERGDRIFRLTRRRVHQLVTAAMEKAGIASKQHTGNVHLLRHSGAIQRLAATGNPRSVQHQLGHRSAEMTLRYLKTLEAEEGIRLQERVDLWR